MTPGGRGCATWLLVAFALGSPALFASSVPWPATAHAHLGHVVQRAERYLKVDATPGGARLVVSLTMGPQEMARISNAADANQDGHVTQAEADAYMAEWGAGLRTELPVTVDGQPVDLSWGQAFFDPIGELRPVGGTVEMVALVPLEGGEQRIVVTDGMRQETFDRTDVAFSARDGAELVVAGVGLDPREVAGRLTYGGVTEVEVLTVVVRLPVVSAPEQRSYAMVGVVGAAVALAAGLLVAVWRRRVG